MDKSNALPNEVTQKVYVILRQMRYDEKPRVVIADYDLSTLTRDPGELCVTLGCHEITLPVPQDVDVIGAHVENLKEQKKKVMAEAQAAINRIEERIQSLLAIEHKG